jgi:predicted AlkP superfamily pyrophosphatase or phosphodiesterase
MFLSMLRLLSWSAALAGSLAPVVPPTDSTPRLVVLIVVDQLQPDELLRYQGEWTGGFKRILQQGVVFSHGRQDHAITQTAPGHSTLLSGRFPAHTGIPTNDRGVSDSLATLIDDPKAVGASPRRFQGTTLADWLIARDSTTRVLSVSMKDRAAILPIGRSREQIYWWSKLGFFTTSRYYRDTLPSWVREWNARRPAARLAGRSWDLLMPEGAYSEPDSMPAEKGPDGRATFPHALPADSTGTAAQLSNWPWMDSLTIDLALAGVHALGIGSDTAGRIDLLSISLSTVDEVGHYYGPKSREMHDMLLRLDRYLGWFLDSLATVAPQGQTLFVLAADHGVQPIPEQTAPASGPPPVRAWPAAMVRTVAAELRDRWRTDFGIRFDYGVVTADVAALRARGVDVDSLGQSLAQRFAREPYVDRVYTPRSLAAAPRTDVIAARWRRTLPAEWGWLVAVTPREGTMWDSWTVGANHGTPWQADVEIPIVFWGYGLTPRSVPRTVRSVDIAPTLAHLLGLRPTERVDGVALPEVRRASP